VIIADVRYAAAIWPNNEFATVDQKKQRGGLGDVLSFFRKREVRLEYRVAPLDAGHIGIKRLFLIDGQAVEDVREAPSDTKKRSNDTSMNRPAFRPQSQRQPHRRSD
jgi:hypothetical protein